MNEQFLQYLWKYRLLHPELRTTTGEKLAVLHPGIQNTDGGPDFFNARIRVGNTVWAGNVEVHIRSGDWIRHRHQGDPAYENVVLHVVYECDQAVRRKNRSEMPTLVLKDNYPNGIEETYRMIMQNHQWIPCSNMVNGGFSSVFKLWAPSLVMDRLSAKSAVVFRLLDEYADWDEVFYILLGTGFGFRINAMPFEMLSRSLPLRIIRRNADSIFRLEALFYGQSGLIARNVRDSYRRSLLAEYRHQQQKYGLKPLRPGLWKKLRLHPFNFPEIRISQFVRLLFDCRGEPSSLPGQTVTGLLEGFCRLSASAYWDTHYVFGKKSARQPKNLGRVSAGLVLINTLAPYLYAYGSAKDISPFRMQAIELLESLKAEDNSECRMWNSAGIKAGNALESQALIQLKRNYCDLRRCLECRIGLKLLGKHQQA